MIAVMFIIILAMTLPVVAALRGVLGKRVQALMLKSSPVIEAAPSTSDEAQEVAATTTPRVIRLDGESISAEADEARQAETRGSLSLFRRWWVYDAVGVTIVLVLWQLFFVAVGGDFGNLSGINLLIAGYLVVITVRYFVYAGQYKDRAIRAAQPPGWFRRWVIVGPEQLLRLFIHPRYSLYPLLFLVYLIFVAASTFFGWMFWAALTLLVVLMLRVHLAWLAGKGTNRRLLILRVFGRDKSTVLTFGAIRRYWGHIGSSFTIVDRSYIRYKYRGHSEIHIAVVLFACMAAIWLNGGAFYWNQVWGVSVALGVIIVLGYIVALVVMYFLAPRSFAASTPQIQDRLERLLRRPRGWDLSFKDLDMYCFDNTWRDAVAAFVDSTDVVLMDLRGYSDQNKGCEYEVDFLFDNLPINRIVFLVDRDNDMLPVEKLIRERWEHLKVDSPNLAVPDPAATVYNIKDQSTADVKGLINTLVADATGRYISKPQGSPDP
jgi:hypothetical protein